METRQKSPVDRSGPALPEIAGAALAHSSGTGRCQQSAVVSTADERAVSQRAKYRRQQPGVF